MIYVDTPKRHDTNLRYKVWSHMWSDENDYELMAMASALNLSPKWLQVNPNAKSPIWQRYSTHFDITPSKYNKALALGAQRMEADEFRRHLERTVVFAPFSAADDEGRYLGDTEDDWGWWIDPNE